MTLRIALAALAAVLGWAVLHAGVPQSELADEVRRLAPQTGAAHPVTAVLLGFRAYDTLLEVAVLLLAVLAATAAAGGAAEEAERTAPEPVLTAMVGFVVPLMLLVAGYLLWAGAKEPGGAFQAGAVLAAAGVLLRLAGKLPPPDPEAPGVRIGLAAGLAVFLGAFVADFLPALILAVEAVLAVSIGLALLCLFAAARR